jgi:hypothetical protein
MNWMRLLACPCATKREPLWMVKVKLPANRTTTPASMVKVALLRTLMLLRMMKGLSAARQLVSVVMSWLTSVAQPQLANTTTPTNKATPILPNISSTSLQGSFGRPNFTSQL